MKSRFPGDSPNECELVPKECELVPKECGVKNERCRSEARLCPMSRKECWCNERGYTETPSQESE